MAIGPRLEFRQSQSLVMTPQLRQAIKLLQFSNIEVAAYIEEELERNPLLERDDRQDDHAGAPCPGPADRDGSTSLDTADLLRREKLPDAAEADHTNSYDAGSPGRRRGGVQPGWWRRPRLRRRRSRHGRSGRSALAPCGTI